MVIRVDAMRPLFRLEPMPSPITVIRNCAWAITRAAHDDAHAYRQGIDIVFSSDGFLHVGPGYAGAADMEIDGRRLMAMPGLVNIHCHSGDEPIAKGLFEDVGTAALWGNALYEFSALVDSDADAKDACQIVMLADLMRSGVTSHLDIAGVHPHWLSLAAESGLRAWLAPGFREAAWRMEGSHRLDYVWDKARGESAMRRRWPSSRRRGRIPPAASTAWSRLRRSKPARRSSCARRRPRRAPADTASRSMAGRPWPSTRSFCAAPARPRRR